jgi:hypothetical protein
MPLFNQYVKKSGDSITVPAGGNIAGLAITQSDTTNNPHGLDIFNSGTGTDFNVENTVNDANFSVRTSGAGKAAFANLFGTATDYQNFSGWVSDVLKWRVGRQGDADGVSVYTLDGATKAVQFKDDQTTSFYGRFGYGTGRGGTVTQATNKSTTAVLNTDCGTVVMNGAALAAATIVTFQLTNSEIAAEDVVMVNHGATGTFGAYTINARAAAGSASIAVRNNTAGSLSEAIVIRFAVIKAVVA